MRRAFSGSRPDVGSSKSITLGHPTSALAISRRLRMPIDDGIAGQVIRTGKPVRLDKANAGTQLKIKTGFLVRAILQVPLIVHLPAALAARFVSDVSAPAYTADITPTLYALLGHKTAAPSPIFGEALFGPGVKRGPPVRRTARWWPPAMAVSTGG